jgi:hemoglobin-like flavoprotein
MSLNIELIEESSARIRADRQRLHVLFSEVLARRHPCLERTLTETDRQALSSLFDNALKALLERFDDPDQLEEAVTEIGRGRIKDLFQPEYMEVFGTTLLEALGEFFGDDWTPRLEAAWDEAIGMARVIMMQAMTGDTSKLSVRKRPE